MANEVMDSTFSCDRRSLERDGRGSNRIHRLSRGRPDDGVRCETRTTQAQGASPACDEKVELFDTMLAYYASYTLENDRVIHHVEAAWNPAWQIDLVRPYVLDGDKLVIDGAAATDPVTGEAIVYSMEFRKV